MPSPQNPDLRGRKVEVLPDELYHGLITQRNLFAKKRKQGSDIFGFRAPVVLKSFRRTRVTSLCGSTRKLGRPTNQANTSVW